MTQEPPPETSERPVISVDDQTTWPLPLADYLKWLDGETPSTPYVSDLETNDRAEESVRYLLRDDYLVAHHSTRLLPHELDMIRQTGLRAFGESLFVDRIHGAMESGAISEEAMNLLLQTHMYATGESESRGRRVGLVCLTLGRTVFDGFANGATPLLSNWGGEGIYFSSNAEAVSALLQSLGRPAIIEARIPVRSHSSLQLVAPPLDRLFLGAMRNLKEVHGDVFNQEDVPASDILNIWRPGDEQYDRHLNLPQA